MKTLQYRAKFSPTSLAGRQVRAVFLSGSPLRHPGGEALDLVQDHLVSIDASGVQHNGSVPLLADHVNETSHLVGLADDIRVDGAKLVGRLNIDGGTVGDFMLAKIRAGSLRAVSVGLEVLDYTSIPDASLPHYRVTAARLRELSLTPIGRDPAALLQKYEDTMTTDNKPAAADETKPAVAAFTEADIERLESLGTLAFAYKHLLKTGDANAAIEAAAHESTRVAASQQQYHRGWNCGGYAMSGADDTTALISEALVARIGGTGIGGKLGNKRLVDLAELTLTARGYNTSSMTPDGIISAAFSPALRMSAEHTTSDFPGILRDASNKALLRSYQAAQSPLTRLFRRNDHRDFKPAFLVRLGEAPALREVLESGEITHGTTSELEASWALKTFGRIFTISRKALINDDLGAFDGFIQTFSQAVAACEADVLFAILSANAYAGQTLTADNKAVFHTDHGNLIASGTAIDIANLGAAIELLRLQRGLEGGWPIQVTPTYLLVGPKKELEARQIVASITPATVANVQPFNLEVLVEPRFGSSLGWYIFASPEQAAVAEYGYLQSQPGPQLATDENFHTLGVLMRAVFDIGAGAVDFRGAVRNPGA